MSSLQAVRVYVLHGHVLPRFKSAIT
jgi:hypothetical protein